MRVVAKRDERGLVLPGWLVALSAVAVVVAMVGFGVSGDRDPEVAARETVPGATGEPGSGEQAGPEDAPAEPDQSAGPGGDQDGRNDQGDPAERRTAYVEVYNNSGISGLADGTAATLQDTGWRVVTTDNWYGEIPSNTVYFPSRLAGQAELLADDLGINRRQPAIAPMAFDRLTVILVSAA